uniref:Integrase catalytic domain-containing protein n=1 Tax=Tanacetum cinerariifolium TaxID=118510 RepID=A0A6L2JJT5_TANCI|nr:hypothetical protein [Tanacetum cinerariifolium]
MTENISYLSDFEEFNRGYVAFGGNPKGGKIIGKDIECVVLSSDFKLPDENHVLLRVPRENNMYNVDLKNVVPSGDLTCHFAKATLDESNLWHIRLGHINLKTMTKLVKGNLVRGLPSKVFENNHTCVACMKGKQHRATCKYKPVSSVSHPLQRLHMDLFRPTFVKSLNKKSYCLVVTDDYSRFSWVFSLATKDETSTILKTFITGIENQINHKVKIPRCDNGTEFKNHDLNQFYGMKGVKREVLVTKPHNKTPYELLLGRTPIIGFMRPFKCHVTILNTLDTLGKFDGKADEGFLVGYSINSKALRSGPKWLFDIDTLTQSMNYQPVVAGNQPNHGAGIKENLDAGKVGKELNLINNICFYHYGLLVQKILITQMLMLPLMIKRMRMKFMFLQVLVTSQRNMMKRIKEKLKETGIRDLIDEFEEFFVNNTNRVNAASAPVTTVGPNPTNNMPALEDIVYSDDEEDVGAEADFSDLETNIHVSPILTTKIHKDHPVTQIIGELNSAPQTMSMARMVNEQGELDQINDEDFHTCMFACFLSQEEPKRVHQALKDPSWIEAMKEELLLFKMQKVWVLVDLPKGKRAIGSKWVFRNKKDERGIVIRSKARLVAQGHTQE